MRSKSKLIGLAAALSVLGAVSLPARLGETSEQLLARYGPPASRVTNEFGVVLTWVRPASLNTALIIGNRSVVESVTPGPNGTTFNEGDQLAIVKRISSLTNWVKMPGEAGAWQTPTLSHIAILSSNSVGVGECGKMTDVLRRRRTELIKDL